MEMAVKTFVPALVRLANRMCKYITKHHATLAATLSGPQLTLLNAMYTACQAFDVGVIEPPEEP
jgi:hypothetical protein